MDVQIRQKEDYIIITPVGELNIYHAAEVLDAFLDSLNKSDKLAVDLSEVAETDTAGIQSLIILKREAFRRKKTVKFLNHSEQIVRIIDLLGLVGLFGDKIKIPAENRGKYSFRYGVKKQEFLS